MGLYINSPSEFRLTGDKNLKKIFVRIYCGVVGSVCVCVCVGRGGTIYLYGDDTRYV